MIICNSCQRENQDSYKFCQECGSSLHVSSEDIPPVEKSKNEAINCPYCAEVVPAHFKFCGACGGAMNSRTDGFSSASGVVRANEVSWSSTGRISSGGLSVSDTRERSVTAQRAPAISREDSYDNAQTLSVTQARLTIVRPDGTEGAVLTLGPDLLQIGRDTGIDALSNDLFLSPLHASIQYKDGIFVVQDHESLNGVFRRISEPTLLIDGDDIRIGQELLRFRAIQQVGSAVPDVAENGVHVHGSPDLGYWGRLELISGLDSSSKVFALHGDEITLGREYGNIVFRDDGFVSGKHARLQRHPQGAILQDVGSSNGTYVRISGQTPLEHGDLLLMGQHLLRFDSSK